jgi:hypothetical protein
VESQARSALPVSQQPKLPVDVRELPFPEAAPEPPLNGLQATPAPRSGSPGAAAPQVAMIRPGPAAALVQLMPPSRSSGLKLLTRLAATESIKGCESRQLPFSRVVESHVYPARLPPGGSFSHCPLSGWSGLSIDGNIYAGAPRKCRGAARRQGRRLPAPPRNMASDEDLAVPPNNALERYSVNTTVIVGGRVWAEQTGLLVE